MDGIRTIIVIVIIAACAVHLLRILAKMLRGKSTGCGCSGGGCGKSSRPTSGSEDGEEGAPGGGI